MKKMKPYEPLDLQFVEFEDRSILAVSGVDHDGDWLEDWGV